MPIALYWSSLKTQDGGFSRTSDHSLPPVLTWHHTWWLVKTVFLLVKQLLGPMPNRVQQQYSIFLNQSLPQTWSKPQLSRTMQFKGLRHFWVTPNYLVEVNQANGLCASLWKNNGFESKTLISGHDQSKIPVCPITIWPLAWTSNHGR